MIIFIYDGSFEGLLTAIYEAYYRKPRPDKIVTLSEYEQNFLNTDVLLQTDRNKAHRVSNAIRSKISDRTLEYTYYAFLSELPGISEDINKYIHQGFKIGNTF